MPEVVANARDAARRTPALIMAAVCLWAALGTAIVYFQNSERVIDSKLETMQVEERKLKGLGGKIGQLEAVQGQTQVISQQIEQVVGERSYWVRLLTDVNKTFTNDLIWITIVEPLKDDRPLTPQLFVEQTTNTDAKGAAATGKPPVFALQLQGLYRKNADGEQIVYQFAKTLAKLPWFDAPDFEAELAKYVSADSGVDEDRYAYKFNIKLPLKQFMQF